MKTFRNDELLSNVIQDFELSVRATNCLMNSKLKTINDLLNCPKENLGKIKNLGKKSEKEITLLIEELRSQTGRFLVVDSMGLPIKFVNERVTFIGEDGNKYYDIEIDEKVFSVRGSNALHRNGLNFISQIRGYTFDNLIALDKMGRGTAQHIVSVLKTFDLSKFEIAATAGQIYGEEILSLANSIAKSLGINTSVTVEILNSIKCEHPDATAESLINLAYQNEIIRDLTKKVILSILQDTESNPLDTIREKLPSFLSNTMIIEELANELEYDRKISVIDTKIKIKYPSLNEVVEKIANPRAKLFIQMQLSGKTLQEIGSGENLSRERVRQIIAKEYKKFPKVDEDKYSYLIENYDISKSDFCMAFSEPESTYIYLHEKGKGYSKPLEDALTDDNLSITEKKCVQKALDKNMIVISGHRILKRKSKIADFIVKTHCINKTHFNEFLKFYNDFLVENGLDPNEYAVNERSYMNKLSDSYITLWNYDGKSFRYYDIMSKDYEQLFDELQLDQYHDVVISSYKLFVENPKLMKLYEIEDEYELHNLLKKIVTPEINSEISFSRMPTIVFGNGSKEKQIYDLLLENAPISAYDLADLYEKKYGEKAAGVMWNTMKCISQYNDHGIYRVDYEPLTAEEFTYLQDTLVNDIYSMAEVKKLYSERFSPESIGKINAFNLRNIGFMHYPNYIIKNTYPSALSYFTQMLLEKDVFTLVIKDFDFASATLNEAIYELEKNRTIIEMLPNEYINIRRLEQIGVSRKNLEDYCDKVNSFVGYGEYFTIRSLRNDGFTHPLDDLGFDDWFYASLLTEDVRFSTRRLGKRKLLCNKSGVIELPDLITTIIESVKKINIFDLIKLLEEQYGITTRIDKLIAVIKSTYCYYDDIMETAYVDYDTYFEEV